MKAPIKGAFCIIRIRIQYRTNINLEKYNNWERIKYLEELCYDRFCK